MTTHETSVVRDGRKFRWACSCGERGDAVTKARAEDGAFYHAYAKRPMTVSEFRYMGDGMNADASDAEATRRVADFNSRL